MEKDEAAYVESRLRLDENNHVVVEGKASICIDECGEPPKSMHIDDLIAHLERGIYEKKKYDMLMWADLQQQSLNELLALKNGTEVTKFSLTKSIELLKSLPRRRADD
jgi:hypothetical protein